MDLPAKTVKAGGHGVPGGENMISYRDGTVRYFTVYEAKLIQTFPKDFVMLGAWGEALRQIGNAVPVVLGEQIGRALFQTIRSESQSLNRPAFHAAHGPEARNRASFYPVGGLDQGEVLLERPIHNR